jgi:hypothetical protein
MADVTLYDRDFRLWALEMSRVVAAGSWDELDRENVAEELASIGRHEQRNANELIRWLLKQLLLWWARPELRCGRWESRILNKRFRLTDILADSPSIDTAPMLDSNWNHAVKWIVSRRGLLQNPFPARCPLTIEQLLDPDYWPDKLC